MRRSEGLAWPLPWPVADGRGGRLDIRRMDGLDILEPMRCTRRCTIRLQWRGDIAFLQFGGVGRGLSLDNHRDDTVPGVELI